jgi:hypothetical protein
MPGFAGLQTDWLSWTIMAGLTACWVISVRFVPGWESEGWPALLKSLYGFVWMGFGLDIVVRFLMLAYNAVEWGDYTVRLITLPVETVNLSLMDCGIFWLLVSVGYLLVSRHRATAGPLAPTRVLTMDLIYAAAVPMALVCSALFFLLDARGAVPLALLTPLAGVASLYAVPATMVWWDHFRRPGAVWRIGGVHLLVLMPALVNGWRSPYRENFAPVFLIPLLGALFAGRRPRLTRLIPAAVVCFLVMSTLVGAYRKIRWENARPEEVASEMKSAGVVDWLAGNFGERMARFHSFDSILLTVHLVPGARPYSGQNVLVEPFIRGVVPRLVNPGKGATDAGQRFGEGIWAYEVPAVRDHGNGAAIAPSMPGDLYDAGGELYVALGALIWGALLGLVDGWKAHLPVGCAAALTALVATHCAMSIERDFDHEVAGLIQTFLVVIVTSGLIVLARRRSTNLSLGLYPGLERS